MASKDYILPISTLLEIGKPKTFKNGDWINYVEEYQLTENEIEDLSNLVSDQELDWESDLEFFGVVHAYRALGQLKAKSAVPALIQLLNDNPDNEWFVEDLPYVFALIGKPSLDSLNTYLTNPKNSLWGRVAVISSISKVAEANPKERDNCVKFLTHVLEGHKQQPEELNASLVFSLLDLKATESISTIEQAYSHGPMDESVCGSIARVKIELGLAKESDFTPEELQYQDPEWMKPLGKVFDKLSNLTSDQTARSSKEIKKLEQKLTGRKKKKPSHSKSGFGFQEHQNNKSKSNK